MTQSLIQLTEHTWIFPKDEDPNRSQPNVGVITTPNHTILVDGGNSPFHGRRVMIAVNEIEAHSITHVIYTHSHWDHTFGGAVYGAMIVGHDLCRKNLVEQAAKPWSHAYLQEEIARMPAREASLRALSRAVEDWRGFHIGLPELVLHHHLTLHLDDLRLEIEHVGGSHAADSVVVRVPSERVMFVGDCYYPPLAHMRRPEDTINTSLIQLLISTDYDVYVDGHGTPLDRQGMETLLQSAVAEHALNPATKPVGD
jgi:glyoxylase-like metal-dependent hydrolase (beta-lactamase superfamily II)